VAVMYGMKPAFVKMRCWTGLEDMDVSWMSYDRLCSIVGRFLIVVYVRPLVFLGYCYSSSVDCVKDLARS
jgi:hypothetical protein